MTNMKKLILALLALQTTALMSTCYYTGGIRADFHNFAGGRITQPWYWYGDEYCNVQNAIDSTGTTSLPNGSGCSDTHGNPLSPG